MENYNNGNEGQAGRSSENENSQSQSGRGNESQSTGNQSNAEADDAIQSRDSSFSQDSRDADVGGNSDKETLGNDDDIDSAPESGTR